MKMIYRQLLCLMLCCLVGSTQVSAADLSGQASLQQLQQQGRLQLRSWVEPQTTHVTSGQVDLYVEVATERWFSRGTRVGLFEVPNAIVMRRVKLAQNSTRRENGKTWSVQRWQLTIYPLAAGKFSVPALPVDISVSSGIDQSVDGRLYTQPLEFQVQTPADLADVAEWIAVPELTFTQSFSPAVNAAGEQAEQAKLEVGDAISRTVTITAPGTAAILLPPISPEAVAGSQVYQDQPKLTDQVNRGQFMASRQDHFTYVISEPGPVKLPPITIHWWSTAEQRAQTLVIPGHTFAVSGWAWKYYARQYGPALGLIVLMLLVLAAGVRHWRIRAARQPHGSGVCCRWLCLLKYLHAVHKRDHLAATELLYRQAGQQATTLRQLDRDPLWQQKLNDWSCASFSVSPDPLSRAKALALWFKLGRHRRHLRQAGFWQRLRHGDVLSLALNNEPKQ